MTKAATSGQTPVGNPFVRVWNDAIEQQCEAAQTTLAFAEAAFNAWYCATTRFFMPVGIDVAANSAVIRGQ